MCKQKPHCNKQFYLDEHCWHETKECLFVCFVTTSLKVISSMTSLSRQDPTINEVAVVNVMDVLLLLWVNISHTFVIVKTILRKAQFLYIAESSPQLNAQNASDITP